VVPRRTEMLYSGSTQMHKSPAGGEKKHRVKSFLHGKRKKGCTILKMHRKRGEKRKEKRIMEVNNCDERQGTDSKKERKSSVDQLQWS